MTSKGAAWSPGKSRKSRQMKAFQETTAPLTGHRRAANCKAARSANLRRAESLPHPQRHCRRRQVTVSHPPPPSLSMSPPREDAPCPSASPSPTPSATQAEFLNPGGSVKDRAALQCRAELGIGGALERIERHEHARRLRLRIRRRALARDAPAGSSVGSRHPFEPGSGVLAPGSTYAVPISALSAAHQSHLWSS